LKEDPDRAEKFTINWEDFYVDFSKNRITEQVQNSLLKLAEECGLKEAMDAYFGGEAINRTEGSSCAAYRFKSAGRCKVEVDGENVMPEVYTAKKKISDFSQQIITGAKKGYTGLAFTDVVNIGIGGSDLGPVMVTESLKFYKNHLNVHYISM
jgi:glucose-6-phosphate isomerase